jgi:hypothetical protein
MTPEHLPGAAASKNRLWRDFQGVRFSTFATKKADVQPDDRCARNFVSAIRIAATVIFWL